MSGRGSEPPTAAGGERRHDGDRWGRVRITRAQERRLYFVATLVLGAWALLARLL